MLNVQDIAQRITKPTLVKKEDLQSLKELSVKYPYSQLFSILYLKGLSKTGNVSFEDELQKHSYRIGNRTQLYDLINAHGDSTEVAPEIETLSEPTNEPSEASREIEITSEEVLVETEDLVEAPLEKEAEIIITDDSTDEVNAEKTTLEKPIVEELEVEVEVESKEIQEIDPVEENILHHAFAANYRLPELSEEEKAELDRIESQKKTKNISNDEVVVPDVDVDIKQSFTSWLDSDKNHKEEVNTDKEAINAIVNDFAEFDPSEGLFGEIEKPKKEFFSPIKKAKESLDEKELPVSETLAKIYALQGNYPKAIDAYSQLIVEYPEKKIFFANLIKDLKNKINTE
jgi:hypothetical protein